MTLLEREVRRTRIDRHDATRRDRRRGAGSDTLTVRPPSAPLDLLITLITPALVVFVKVQVHMAPG